MINKLPSIDVIVGGAHTSLLAVNLASSIHGCFNFPLEGDLLSIILAITNAHLILEWIIAPIIEDILSKAAWQCLKKC